MKSQRGSTRPLVALFVAELISTTGSEMTAVALPWFVLTTSGSPARMGLVMAAEFLGIAVCGIPSGSVATALGPRRTMLTSDLVRAPLVALVPILHWADLLTFPLLLGIAFAVGAFFPAYTSSQQLLMADLVADDELRMTRVGGVFGSMNETASFIGPAVGGLLVAIFGAAGVLLVDAASYLVAFLIVAALVPPKPRADTEDERGTLDGLRYVLRERGLRDRVIGLGIVEIGFTAMVATLPVVAFTRFDATARLAGWFLAAYGAGSVAGELISTRAKTAGDRTARLAILALAVTTWPLLFQIPAWAVALAVAANGVCSGLFFPRFFAALTVRTPKPLRARVQTTVTTGMSAAGPLGFVGAGLLLQHSDTATAGFVLVVIAATVGALVVARGYAASVEPTGVSAEVSSTTPSP